MSLDPTQGVVIHMLGAFRVVVSGREVTSGAWPGRRSVELVQLLALNEGHQLLRDRVIEALWPHLDPEAGAANLRKAAHFARRVLGDPKAVVLRGGLVRLFPSTPVRVDTEHFEDLSKSALARGDIETCARAAAAYHGDLLPESLYEEWTERPRQRLRATYIALLRASKQWARIIQFEPTDESAYMELMRAALDRGARTIAIGWYGKLRAALERDLHMSPGQEAQRLYDRCVAGLEAAVPGFVGRQVELARITDLVRSVSAGRIGCVVVRGPAGIGKSTFSREAARLAEKEGWHVARVDIATADRPYGPVVDVVENLLAAAPDLLAAQADHPRSVLAALTPAAAPALPIEGALSRHQVVGAFRGLLVAAGAGDPVMLIVDEVDLAPDATTEALLQLAMSGPPVLVVLAYRSEAGNTTLKKGVSRLLRADRLATIDLGPLDAAEAADLVLRAAARPLEPEVVRRIVDLGEGNPFATLEIARGIDPADPSRLPPTAAEAIATRFVDLDPEIVARLQRIALVGGELDSAMVVALMGVDEESAFESLDRALEIGVLVVAGERYRFRHDLVRQALVDRVPPHQRLAVHRDAAGRLTELGAPPALIARHWLAGERPTDAEPWLLAAARHAMEVGAFSDALGHLAPLAHDPRHHAALRLRAEALDMLGDPGTLAAYDAAIETADESDADDLRAMRALAQIKQGDPPGALRAIAGVKPTSVHGRLCEALTYSGAAALGYGDPAFGTEKAAESRRLALDSGDAAAIVVASWAQAAAAHARGELRDSVLADLFDTSDLPHLAVRVFDGQLCVMQRFLYGSKPYDDVIAFADGLVAEARRLGAARGLAYGVTLRGEAELLSGRLDAAEIHLTEGKHLHRAIGGATGEAFALQRLGELALYRGHTAAAAAHLDQALDLARQSDVGFHLLDRIYGTRMALASDPHETLAALEEAEHAVRGPLETCPGCRITFVVPAAIASARAGDLERAVAYEKAAAWHAGVVMRLPAWDAALEEVRGHIARASGDPSTAAARFSAAAEGFARAEHPLDQARCVELARG